MKMQCYGLDQGWQQEISIEGTRRWLSNYTIFFTTSDDGIRFSYRIMKVGNKIIDRLIIRIVELFLWEFFDVFGKCLIFPRVRWWGCCDGQDGFVSLLRPIIFSVITVLIKPRSVKVWLTVWTTKIKSKCLKKMTKWHQIFWNRLFLVIILKIYTLRNIHFNSY